VIIYLKQKWSITAQKPRIKWQRRTVLTIRLLESCSGSGTSKLLGLVPPRISNKERSVKLNQDILDLLLALLVNVLLIICYKRLGKSLPDGIDLGGMTTTLHTDTDVDVSKSVFAEEKDRLLQLVGESSGLNQLKWATIDLDQTLSTLAVGHGSGGLLAPEDLD